MTRADLAVLVATAGVPGAGAGVGSAFVVRFVAGAGVGAGAGAGDVASGVEAAPLLPLKSASFRWFAGSDSLLLLFDFCLLAVGSLDLGLAGHCQLCSAFHIQVLGTYKAFQGMECPCV